MKALILCQSLICGTTVCLSAPQFYSVMRPADPNHLVPIRARGEYEARLAETLFIRDGEFFGRMVVRPAFEPEYCLSFHADVSEATIRKYGGERTLVPDDEKAYVLTVTSASSSIWGAQGQKTNEIRITRFEKPISVELAAAIQRVWGKAVHLTRYASGSVGGYDGVTYEFSAWVRGLGVLEGETWCPVRGLPAALAGIGEDLVAFVRQSDKAKVTEQKLIRRLKKIESRIPRA